MQCVEYALSTAASNQVTCKGAAPPLQRRKEEEGEEETSFEKALGKAPGPQLWEAGQSFAE